MRLVPLRSADDAATARALVREYVASLGRAEEFDGLDDERTVLPTHYGPPDGVFLLAYHHGALAGCGALRRFDARAAELRRLYVLPAFRGQGAGRALVEALVHTARTLGYRRVYLDTLEELTAAQALYRALGFAEVAPYYASPHPGTRYFALDLAPHAA